MVMIVLLFKVVAKPAVNMKATIRNLQREAS
jgi:hypothetical protein